MMIFTLLRLCYALYVYIFYKVWSPTKYKHESICFIPVEETKIIAKKKTYILYTYRDTLFQCELWWLAKVNKDLENCIQPYAICMLLIQRHPTQPLSFTADVCVYYWLLSRDCRRAGLSVWRVVNNNTRNSTRIRRRVSQRHSCTVLHLIGRVQTRIRIHKTFCQTFTDAYCRGRNMLKISMFYPYIWVTSPVYYTFLILKWDEIAPASGIRFKTYFI